ncbi:uncharacterized protein LOC119681633 [Teleopsis dalmanni]|uniref:uncharacterized protein LOC119681633 n=1 Tax=Teleopsis dalmanni TaxID=139649 RepID=UPI0018CF3E33|nr:uncharacterized protein LOC119681633 [Teleopsis dalmanni]
MDSTVLPKNRCATKLKASNKHESFEIPIMQVPQLALGTPTLNKLQLSLLHSLLDTIMQKLDCQNDKIKVSEILGHIMETNLKTSTSSPVPFFVKGMDSPTFTDKINELRNDIDAVLPKVYKYIQPKVIKYDHPCYIHHRYNANGCILLSNKLFYAPFMEDIVVDLSNYITYMEELVDYIGIDTEIYQYWTNNIYCYIYLLLFLEETIGPMHNLLHDYYYRYLEGMIFLQNALDNRFDNKDLLKIKTEAKELFQRIEEMLKELEFEQKRLRVVGFDLNCDVCGKAEIGRTPDMSVFDKPAINPETLMKEKDPLELYRTYLKTKCDPDHFDLIEGYNTALFRKA